MIVFEPAAASVGFNEPTLRLTKLNAAQIHLLV